MTIHEKIIMEAVGCSEEVAGKLAEIIQKDIFKSSLDWISKEELTAAAKKAEKIYLTINQK